MALREWIVKVTAWVYCSESHQMLGSRSLSVKETGCKANCFWGPLQSESIGSVFFHCLWNNKTQWGYLNSWQLYLQFSFEAEDIYHNQHLQHSTAYSHITSIRILWKVIPLTLPLKKVHSKHNRTKTSPIYYLSNYIYSVMRGLKTFLLETLDLRNTDLGSLKCHSYPQFYPI